MDELNLFIESLINSELDDMILDLVYEIHSSIKGIPQEQFQINNYTNKSNSIEKQTCICPNCGQTNLIATRFAYHLAKCLGAGRQSSRQAQRRIVDQIMLISDYDTNDSNQNHCFKDEQNNSISQNETLVTNSKSNLITLNKSNKTRVCISNENEEYIDDDDWKPKKKKRRITSKTMSKIKDKKMKDVLVVMSPSTSQLDSQNNIIPLNKIHPVTKHVVIPLVPLPISSVNPSNGDKIFFKTQRISSHSAESSHYLVESPLNLVEDEQSSIIIFKEDINN